MIDDSVPNQPVDLLAKHDTPNITKAIAALEKGRFLYRLIAIFQFVYCGLVILLFLYWHYMALVYANSGLEISPDDKLILNVEILLFGALFLGMIYWMIWIQRNGPLLIRQALESSGIAEKIAMEQLDSNGLVQRIFPKFPMMTKYIRYPSFQRQLIVAATHLRWFLKPTPRHIYPEVYAIGFYCVLFPFWFSLTFSIRSAISLGLAKSLSYGLFFHLSVLLPVGLLFLCVAYTWRYVCFCEFTTYIKKRIEA